MKHLFSLSRKLIVTIIITLFIISKISAQTYKIPRLYLIPLGGTNVSFSYYKQAPSYYFKKQNAVGSLLGCLVEFKFNESFSIVSGVYDPWIANKYKVNYIVKSSVGGGYQYPWDPVDKSFPFLFKYNFNSNLKLSSFIQFGFLFNCLNKYTYGNNKYRIWSHHDGSKLINVAKMRDFNYGVNSYSLFLSVGLFKKFYRTSDFNISLDANIGFKEFMWSSVDYWMMWDSNIWYFDKIGNKADFIGLSLGYSIPVLKKAITYKTSKVPIEILKPIRKPKKQILPEGYLPRMYFHTFGGFTFPISYTKSPLNGLFLRTTTQYGGYYGGNVEFMLFNSFSLLTGFTHAYHATAYKIYYSTFKPFFKSNSGQNKNEIPIKIKYYLNTSKKIGLFGSVGVNFISMYKFNSSGSQNRGFPNDSIKNYKIQYWRDTPKNNFNNLTFGIGVYKKVFKSNKIALTLAYDIGFSEIQNEKYKLEYKNTIFNGEIGTKGSAISCFIDYSIPIFQRKIYLKE